MKSILRWYDENARDLPWRVPPHSNQKSIRPDPYHIWLSEIMLQQTTVAAVKPYYQKFLSLWPTISNLAKADRTEIMAAWAGLGYYSRARNLKKCAEEIHQNFNGEFPDRAKELIKLPGIGPYTSASIAAIAFGEQIAVVDGNVERVISRFFRIAEQMPAGKKIVAKKLAGLVPASRPGDFAQALMDLGATICTPRSPHCEKCPVAKKCEALAHNDVHAYPNKPVKKAIPVKKGIAFLISREDGYVLLHRRPEKGLLGGMTGFPTSDWGEHPDITESLDNAPIRTDWVRSNQISKHTFTHFKLELEPVRGSVGNRTKAPDNFYWCCPDKIDSQGLPTIFAKLVRFLATRTQRG